MVAKRERIKAGSTVPQELLRRMQTEHGDWYGFRMGVIGTLFSYEPFLKIYKQFNIVGDDYTILSSLYDWGAMTANVICTLSGRPKNSISRAVIKMTERGLVESMVDPEDRRRALLSITKSGRALYEKMMPICRVQEERMFGFLSKADLVVLDDILLRVLRNWSYQLGGVDGQKEGSSDSAQTLHPNGKSARRKLTEAV